jgi:hypothetical protein
MLSCPYFALRLWFRFVFFGPAPRLIPGFQAAAAVRTTRPPTVAFIKIQITAEDVIEFIGLIKPGRDDMRKLARSIGPGVGLRKSRIVPPKI